jgi:hypothetical protein
MEDRLKRLFGTDKDREDPRRKAEMKIVWKFLDTVLSHGQQMLTAKRHERLTNEGSASGAHGATVLKDLTEKERAIFNRPSYYGWTEGSIAGGVTFVVLFGGLRLAAMRSGRTAAKMNRQPPQVRKNYSDLDLPNAKGNSSSRRGNGNKGDSRRSDGSTSQQRQQQHQQQQNQEAPTEDMSVGEDVMLQLQFMCTGAMALAVMSFAANMFADLPKFYRELSALPLQAGPSPLCHAMCPDLIQQMERMRTNQMVNDSSTRPRRQSSSGSNSDSDDNTSEAELQLKSSELVQDPNTEELESMVRMVQNCQQRAALEQSLRHAQGIEDSNQVMDIPAPGVPPNYLGVSVEGSDGSGDDTENGYEWAKGLVVDREDNGSQSK